MFEDLKKQIGILICSYESYKDGDTEGMNEIEGIKALQEYMYLNINIANKIKAMVKKSTIRKISNAAEGKKKQVKFIGILFSVNL